MISEVRFLNGTWLCDQIAKYYIITFLIYLLHITYAVALFTTFPIVYHFGLSQHHVISQNLAFDIQCQRY
jgi:uncharacterized membrane protein YesL